MRIQVFGPGCQKCNETEQIVRKVLEESGIQAEISKVTDFQEMAQAGVFSTPAVAIDGTIKISGSVPKPKDVRSWLQQ